MSKNVVFVGDAPTKDNSFQDVAFAGTKSMTTLARWIKIIDPDFYVCFNSVADADLYKIMGLSEDGFKVVALGNNASKRLSRIFVPHHKMNHPSGLSRKNNDKVKLEASLRACREFVHSS